MKKLSYLIILTLILGLVLTGCLPSKNQSPIITSTPGNLAEVGELYTYEVEATDPDGDTLTYSLDVKPSGMTIDSTTGLISWTPTAEGDYDVVVKVSDGALEITQSFTIEVSEEEGPGYVPPISPPSPPAVKKLISIVVDPNTMSLFVGQTITEELLDNYSITAHYNFGPTKDIDFDNCKIYLTVEAALIIELSEGGNVVTAVLEGTGDLIFSYTEDGITKTDTLTIIVSPEPVTGVTLDKIFMMLKAGGATGTLVATVAPADATNKSVTWDSSKPVVATVDDGVVTPLTVGTAIITVETVDGGFTATCKVKVLKVTPEPAPEPVTGVTLKPTTLDLTAGDDPVTLVATISPANATNKSVTWDSSDDLVATVDAGVVTPVGYGKATITVTTVDGGFTAECAVGVSAAPVVGDSYGGGIVAYIFVDDDPGYVASEQHGLIAATADQSDRIQWYNGSYTITGAIGTALGTGSDNTTTIITSQGATATDYAAGIARAYNGGGYDDWFLPSKDELNKLYINKDDIGGFAGAHYWSSSEDNVHPANGAWYQGFNDGGQGSGSKKGTSRVRAVRAF